METGTGIYKRSALGKTKGSHPVITILGSNSGNNVGDAAILASILEALSQEIPNAEFLVPSTKPSFVKKNYAHQYNVKAIDVMPWTGSIRLLGIPTMRAIAKSDVTLITDGIIFDVKLFNPLFNFLITLVFLAPWAKIRKSKLVCYSCGIGPLRSFFGRRFAKWVIQSCDLVIMRENDSKSLAQEIGVKKPIQVTGDAAFLNTVSTKERALKIFDECNINPEAPLFGINVTSYIDQWLSGNERVQDGSKFIETLAEGINEAKAKLDQPFFPVVFSTHPMDVQACSQLAQLTSGAVITSAKYLSHDLQACMRECELFIGMRFHSVVLASAVEVPIIGLVYAPKVRGFMELLECQNYSIELADVSKELISSTVINAWEQRAEIKAQQKEVVDKLKAGAKRAAEVIRERYFPHVSPAKSQDPIEESIPSEALAKASTHPLGPRSSSSAK